MTVSIAGSAFVPAAGAHDFGSSAANPVAMANSSFPVGERSQAQAKVVLIPGLAPLNVDIPVGVRVPEYLIAPNIVPGYPGVQVLDRGVRPGTAAPIVANATIHGVHGRTAMAIVTDQGIAATPNAYEARPALSTIKLLLVDYALHRGDGSAADRVLAERAIRASDDAAASALFRKYPQSIDEVARAHGMTATRSNGYWGNATTSAADLARYLNTIKREDPGSIVLQWMREAYPVAADGTVQNWGTHTLPRIQGTKWGWSDMGAHSVASASFADNYTAVALTWGGPKEQNADVPVAIGYVG
ncbi:serine hydrolase [Corynebacterium lizhenjunii]|uniref:serine hydrolase n=1 Tax=Corynebacterium lizhenjunii TaxID=2709394 RepID=UPI0013EBCBC7|nr:serine hydrolase [Corynebacterium lizhenjunii]